MLVPQFLSSWLVFVCTLTAAKTTASSTSPIRQELTPIDGDAGKYHVQWEMDLSTSRATFLVVVETRGYVGFGISRGKGMNGADIVIGGVYDDGRVYFADRHGTGNTEPALDVRQDYELTMVYENETHTHLQFYRLLNTCDDQDVPITADTLSLIWSYSASDSDVLQYHGSSRGTYAVNLLEPPAPPFEGSLYDKWVLTPNVTMPPAPTTYWCSMYKSPTEYASTGTRHAVAFNTRLPTPEALRHAHHLDLYRCTAPPGVDPDVLFGPFTRTEGHDCIAPPEAPEPSIPQELCLELIYNWAIGGKAMSFPDNVGYPITVDGAPEYFLIVMHYDNPEMLEGLQFEAHVEIYNTLQLRKQEAAIAVVSHAITFSHVVPPLTPSYTTVGHCSSACTAETLRPEGVSVFNVLLHAHQAARSIRLRHFRGRSELPWIAADDNYDFNFQQNRPLRENVRLMPGDHLTTECGQNTAGRVNVTLSGLGTVDEMCQAMVWYYPAGDLRFCESMYDPDKIMERFGIEEMEWPNIMQPPVILAPPELANKTFQEVLNTMVSWSPTYVAEMEAETRYRNHLQASCGRDYGRGLRGNEQGHSKRDDDKDVIGYPEIDEEYAPENPCLTKP